VGASRALAGVEGPPSHPPDTLASPTASAVSHTVTLPLVLLPYRTEQRLRRRSGASLSPISPRLWPILNTQACDLCQRLATSIAEVSPGFAAQGPEARLEPQVVA